MMECQIADRRGAKQRTQSVRDTRRGGGSRNGASLGGMPPVVTHHRTGYTSLMSSSLVNPSNTNKNSVDVIKLD